MVALSWLEDKERQMRDEPIYGPALALALLAKDGHFSVSPQGPALDSGGRTAAKASASQEGAAVYRGASLDMLDFFGS